jgi:hypothetical protein
MNQAAVLACGVLSATRTFETPSEDAVPELVHFIAIDCMPDGDREH